MTGYNTGVTGYLNPVSVDKVQHPDYDAKFAENTTMRVVQYLYPVIHNCTQMLEALCTETEVTVPTDLKDNVEFLKKIFTTEIDWHPRTMFGQEAAEELNAKLSLHEELSKQEGNEHQSIMNWSNPYGQSGQLAQAPPQMQMNPYMQQQQYPMMQQQGSTSVFKPWTWFGVGTGAAAVQPWQLPPPRIDTLANGEQYYTANGGGPPPLAQQQGYTELPVGSIGWNTAGQPIDLNGQVVATTGEKLMNTALQRIL